MDYYRSIGTPLLNHNSPIDTNDSRRTYMEGWRARHGQGHGAVVRDVLVEMTGDRFHPFVCGHGRSLKPQSTATGSGAASS